MRVIGLVHVCGHVLFPDSQGHGISVGPSPARVRKVQMTPKTSPPDRFVVGVLRYASEIQLSSNFRLHYPVHI